MRPSQCRNSNHYLANLQWIIRACSHITTHVAAEAIANDSTSSIDDPTASSTFNPSMTSSRWCINSVDRHSQWACNSKATVNRCVTPYSSISEYQSHLRSRWWDPRSHKSSWLSQNFTNTRLASAHESIILISQLISLTSWKRSITIRSNGDLPNPWATSSMKYLRKSSQQNRSSPTPPCNHRIDSNRSHYQWITLISSRWRARHDFGVWSTS